MVRWKKKENAVSHRCNSIYISFVLQSFSFHLLLGNSNLNWARVYINTYVTGVLSVTCGRRWKEKNMQHKRYVDCLTTMTYHIYIFFIWPIDFKGRIYYYIWISGWFACVRRCLDIRDGVSIEFKVVYLRGSVKF